MALANHLAKFVGQMASSSHREGKRKAYQRLVAPPLWRPNIHFTPSCSFP
jgi:hypothetical protein